VGTDLTPLLESNNYLRSGRPGIGCDDSIENRNLCFLAGKLNCGIEPIQGAKISPECALSAVLCRIPTSVHPHHHYASEIVANNMATLFVTDSQREATLCGFQAEAKLALASAINYWRDPSLFSQIILPFLKSAILTNAVEKGKRGEIVASILLLQAIDNACSANNINYPGSPVSIQSVLIQLLPENILKKNAEDIVNKCIPDKLKNAKIACLQFVPLSYDLRKSTIVELAERRCGALFREGQPGADFVLPLFDKELALLLVQAKSYETQHAKDHKKLPDKLMPSNVFQNNLLITSADREHFDKHCVRIVLQLSAPNPAAKTSKNSNKATQPLNSEGMAVETLEIFGLESRCLSPEIRKELTIMLRDDIDISSIQYEVETELEEEFEKKENRIIDKCAPFFLDNNDELKFCSYTNLQLKEFLIQHKKDNDYSYGDTRTKENMLLKIRQYLDSKKVDKMEL
jgi:hypothetical protein